MTDPAPRDRDEIEADLLKRHNPTDAMGYVRRSARLVQDVRPLLQRAERAEAERDALLDRLDATEKRLAAVEKFARRVADLGDPDVPDMLEQRRRVTLGQLTAEARRALAAVPGVAENGEQRQDGEQR